MAGVVSHWLVIMEADVQSQASPCGIYGGRSDTVTYFKCFVFLIGILILMHLLLTLYNLSH
jgi:hypothetical protein